MSEDNKTETPVIPWMVHCIMPGSPEQEEQDKELQPERWTQTDEADKFRSHHAAIATRPDRRGYTTIPVLEFLKGRPWDNMALNVVYALNPTFIRISEDGFTTCDSWRGRVTVYLEEDKKTIKDIVQEVEVGLIGCRFGADVSAYIHKREPIPKGFIGSIGNIRSIRKLELGLELDEPKEDKKGFTLIELMIVLAIIGILVSIAASNYTPPSAGHDKAVEQAKSWCPSANKGFIKTACVALDTDEDGYISCTCFYEDARPIAVECAGVGVNQGCRMPKMRSSTGE